jgi:hypothetical protein
MRLTGVVKDGKALSYEEMSEQVRKEILSLSVDFTGNERTNRYELVVRGAGNDAVESTRALDWMRLILTRPNWQKENLPRIRDVVDQQLGALRRRMQGSEESWVNNPATSYLKQDSPLYLSAFSFLTQTHNVQRLRWLLKDAGDAENKKAIDEFLTRLAAAKGNRDELKTLLAAMQGDKAQAEKVSADLKSLADDFGKLSETAKNLATEAARIWRRRRKKRCRVSKACGRSFSKRETRGCFISARATRRRNSTQIIKVCSPNLIIRP